MTKVLLADARTLVVFNIAWGEDMEDDYEHITSNCSPFVDGAPADLFFTDEVDEVVDPIRGAILWKTNGTALAR